MATGYGLNVVDLGSRKTRVLCQDNDARWKTGGTTIDWSLVTTTGDGTTALPDGTIIPNGVKYIRYGTVMAKVTASRNYAPMNTSLTNGTQTADATVRGERFILNQTLRESDLGSSFEGDMFDQGTVFKSRVLMGGTNQPTEAQVETMLPGITWHND